MSKPPVNNCATCMRLAIKGGKAPAAVACVSPTGKAHWRNAQGITFCGKDGRGPGWWA